MSDTPMPLSPDEGRQENVAMAQPYGLAAVMFGMAVLLVSRGALPHLPLYTLLYLAVIGGIMCYVLVLVTRMRLPLLLLTVFAALLGLGYSLPSQTLYVRIWHHASALAGVVPLVVFSSLIGLLIGYVFPLRRYPRQVIAVGFLTTFVLISALTAWRH